MAKKIIAWLLVVVLTAGAAIGGTLAYLTDRDSEANVFTVGDVDITLDEEFQQGSQLLPGAGVEKDVQIKNEGPNDAWVWYTYAVPQGLEAGLILSFDNTDQWTAGDLIGTKEVDGVTYNVYVSKYKTVLADGATTGVGLTKVTMDPAVDITPEGDAYLVNAGATTSLNWNINNTENPIIFINAYAIQTEGFADVDAAYAAFAGQWGNMVDAGTYDGATQNPGEGEPDPEPAQVAYYNGTFYASLTEAVQVANANGGGDVLLNSSAIVPEALEIDANITLKPYDSSAHQGYYIARATGYTGDMLVVKSGKTLTIENVTLDGMDQYGNATMYATGALVATQGNGHVVLNAGCVVQNNIGYPAVYIDHTEGKGGSLVLNGAAIASNASDKGAIWGGGNITVNEGTEIRNNKNTHTVFDPITEGGGAIRMVSDCTFTMNGGHIYNNESCTRGGAIYGWGASTYNFNGGKIDNNTAPIGGAVYVGLGSTVNVSGSFEMTGNTAEQEAGGIRLTSWCVMKMTGGKITGNTCEQKPQTNNLYGWDCKLHKTGGNLGAYLLEF